VTTIGKVQRFLDAKKGTTMKAAYDWQELYEDALRETNREKMQLRIRAAKAAIEARLQELQLGHGGTPEERQAVSDALTRLNLLRKEIETRSYDSFSDRNQQ
jgi:hypothetical protein